MMSKQQWIGLAIVLLMVTAAELTVHWAKQWRTKQTATEVLTFQPEREQEFEQYLDSLREAEYVARKAEYAKQYADKHPQPIIHLQPFDPNTADSATLVTVGLKPWMAKSLIRYREAGKVFHRPDELRSLYGMNDTLYATLEPYIQIDSVFRAGYSGEIADSMHIESRVKKDTILNMNTADTTELQYIRGVGRYTAMQIIRYRQALGGYYCVNQLYEVEGLPKERVDSIVSHFYTDSALITAININRASVKQMQRHPYISYRQAQQVYDLRRRKLQLCSLDELSEIFTADERQRLRPYMLFECK